MSDQDFNRSLVHMVRQGLRLTKVYYAPWQILIEKTNDHNLLIIGILPPNITLPHGLKRPLQAIQFRHEQEVAMHHFTDVNFAPICTELAKEILKAYHFGEKYGTSEAVDYKIQL